jgi:iron complex outermembrane receptor protein
VHAAIDPGPPSPRPIQAGAGALPACDILNLRVGWRREGWDVSLYANNALNELAYLALDRERGTLARIGYIVNQPRTIGIATRFSF